MKKKLKTRNTVLDLLMWVPILVSGMIVSYVCTFQFGLTMWQTTLMVIAVECAVRYGISEPLHDDYFNWSPNRELLRGRPHGE
ncbi:hypothetical protein [Paraburkholderia sp. SIMBA_054]|uniref:hypothetical protein n=1 Tax=Paraburkholderia sp. SIMBA_054 TaxID=3085795 RepID=UPI00397E6156